MDVLDRTAWHKSSITRGMTKLILILISFLSSASFADQILEQSTDTRLGKGERTLLNAHRNNSAYGFELGYSLMPATPQMFANDALNTTNRVSLNGLNVSLFKGFALSSDFFTVSNLRGFIAQDDAPVEPAMLQRKTKFTSGQFVQQFGYNLLKIKIDSATLHPFVGIGAYWAELEDEYAQLGGSGFNRLTSTGLVAEVGASFIDQGSGIYTTLKIGTLQSFSIDSESTNVSNPDLDISTSPELSKGLPLVFSIGFGIKI